MKRTYTVDSNFLRHRALEELVRDRAEHRFIIPDLVMLEAAKTRNRELTIRESLRILSAIPERVFIGRSVSELMRSEIDAAAPITNFAIYYGATDVIRRLLEAIRDNSTNEILQEILTDPFGHIPALISDHLTHDVNRQRALQFQYDGFERLLPNWILDLLRRDRLSQGTLMNMTRIGAIQACYHTLVDQFGFTPERALHMINSHSVVMRFHYAKYWMALKLYIRSEIKNRPAAQISNDNIDAHNAIIASQFGHFLSYDQFAQSTAQVTTVLSNLRIRYGLSGDSEGPAVVEFS